MNLNGRRVKFAKMHSMDVVVPGIGGLGTVLPMPNKTLQLDMIHTESGLHVVVANKAEFTIPWGNIQMVIYTPESPIKPA